MVGKKSVFQVDSIFVLEKKTQIKMTSLLFVFHVTCTKFSNFRFINITINQEKKQVVSDFR